MPRSSARPTACPSAPRSMALRRAISRESDGALLSVAHARTIVIAAAHGRGD